MIRATVPATSSGREAERMVTFVVAGTVYAAAIQHVERVLRDEGVHTIPGMPAWMHGVIDVDGEVVPVVDVRRRLGLPDGDDSVGGPRGRLLLFSVGGNRLAARVDRVLDVRVVAGADVVTAPTLFQGAGAEYLRGIVRRDGGLLFILDVARLFRTELSGVTATDAASSGSAEPAVAPTDSGEALRV